MCRGTPQHGYDQAADTLGSFRWLVFEHLREPEGRYPRVTGCKLAWLSDVPVNDNGVAQEEVAQMNRFLTIVTPAVIATSRMVRATLRFDLRGRGGCLRGQVGRMPRNRTREWGRQRTAIGDRTKAEAEGAFRGELEMRRRKGAGWASVIKAHPGHTSIFARNALTDTERSGREVGRGPADEDNGGDTPLIGHLLKAQSIGVSINGDNQHGQGDSNVGFEAFAARSIRRTRERR
jgi:hypothetical protein